MRREPTATTTTNSLTENVIDNGTTPVTWTFTYGLYGNMTSKSASRRCSRRSRYDPSASVGTDTTTYTRDTDNRLLGVDLNSLSVVDYVYDSSSRMLQRVVDAPTTTTSRKALRSIHWDGWDLVKEIKTTGAVIETTDYLVPQGEVHAFQRDGDWFYLHGDALSSTQLVTDENGDVVARLVYGAWGQALSVTETVPGLLDTRFVGGLGVRNDSATGLIWMRNRWVDPALQRFISRDPIGLVDRRFALNTFQGPARFHIELSVSGIFDSKSKRSRRWIGTIDFLRLIRDSNLSSYAANSPTWNIDPHGLAPSIPTNTWDPGPSKLPPFSRILPKGLRWGVCEKLLLDGTDYCLGLSRNCGPSISTEVFELCMAHVTAAWTRCLDEGKWTKPGDVSKPLNAPTLE